MQNLRCAAFSERARGICEQRIRTIFASSYEPRIILSSLSVAEVGGIAPKLHESTEILSQAIDYKDFMAEREGFEVSVPF